MSWLFSCIHLTAKLNQDVFKDEEMKPFRKKVAIAVDGGGMRGLMVTKALSVLEDYLQTPAFEIFRLAVGTSTGSVISAGIAMGLTAEQMTGLYQELGHVIFPSSVRRMLFPLTRYRYPIEPLEGALQSYFGQTRMGELWEAIPAIDLVITAYDLHENRTRFIKPWKAEYAQWPLVKAVQASCSVPTYFPVLENRYIDGGIGSYGNPCYVAAYEARECLEWDARETTLISIGTGRAPYAVNEDTIARFRAWHWLSRVLGIYSQSAQDQQEHLVQSYFKDLDFRRFQITLREPIEMDDTSQAAQLLAYGARLGRMIIHDQYDPNGGIVIKQADRT